MSAPTWARRALDLVDVAASDPSGRPIGLRDGALLALVDAGLEVPTIADLRVRDPRYVAEGGAGLILGVARHVARRTWVVCLLDTAQGARVLAYLAALRDAGAADAGPLFPGPDPARPLSVQRIYQILDAYRRRLAEPAAAHEEAGP